MAMKFDPHKRKKLSSEERKALLTPPKTLAALGYDAGLDFADIGCGTGLFTFPAAEIGGRDARIFAVDISELMVNEVQSRARAEGYTNIQTIQSGEYNFKLASESADFLLICTVLHEVEDKLRFLREAFRICRPGAVIAVIEFNETITTFGPPPAHRLKQREVSLLLEAAGFSAGSSFGIHDAFYAIKAVRPTAG